jgi:peptidoglycan/LPS O-acetylase OafA/YrhL
MVFVYYIRALASLSVAVAHIYNEFLTNFYNSSPNMLIKILLEFIYTGGFGVSMFFLLSGFIVPYSYVDIRSFFLGEFLEFSQYFC